MEKTSQVTRARTAGSKVKFLWYRCYIMGKPSKEALYELYYEKDMNYSQMAKRLDTHTGKIGDWMKEYNINPGKGGYIPIPVDKRELARLYYDEGLSQAEIGDKFDVSQEVISSRMEEWGIAPGKRVDLMADAVRVPWATHRINEDGYEVWKVRVGYEMKTVPVHRLIAVAEYGAESVGGNVVHHKNGIKWDNRPENLEVLSDTAHKSKHADRWERDKQGRFSFN